MSSLAAALAVLPALAFAQRTTNEPVPVPAAVAIARPSPAEVTQLEQSFARFVSTADANIKAVLAKYPDVLAVRPPRVNPATIPWLNTAFEAKHQRNLARAKAGDIDLLLMGDSITDFWRNEGAPGVKNPARAGARVFAQYFGELKSANFGISGDTTQGVLFRLRDGEGAGFSPKAIMLMIGTNNLATCTGPEIAEGIGAIVLELRKDFPRAKILLLGIFPRADPRDPMRQTIREINARIAKLGDDQAVFYRNIGDKFLGDGGVIPPDVMPDQLHPSDKGYVIWAEAVKDTLRQLLQ